MNSISSSHGDSSLCKSNSIDTQQPLRKFLHAFTGEQLLSALALLKRAQSTLSVSLSRDNAVSKRQYDRYVCNQKEIRAMAYNVFHDCTTQYSQHDAYCNSLIAQIYSAHEAIDSIPTSHVF